MKKISFIVFLFIFISIGIFSNEKRDFFWATIQTYRVEKTETATYLIIELKNDNGELVNNNCNDNFYHKEWYVKKENNSEYDAILSMVMFASATNRHIAINRASSTTVFGSVSCDYTEYTVRRKIHSFMVWPQ